VTGAKKTRHLPAHSTIQSPVIGTKWRRSYGVFDRRRPLQGKVLAFAAWSSSECPTWHRELTKLIVPVDELFEPLVYPVDNRFQVGGVILCSRTGLPVASEPLEAR
jgi:hypothetical protein